MDAAESGHAGELVEAYLRLDESAGRYDAIAEAWNNEMRAERSDP